MGAPGQFPPHVAQPPNPASVHHFIPHQLQRQLPRNITANQVSSFDPSHNNAGGSQNAQNVNYTVTPMAMPSAAHQSSAIAPQAKKSKSSGGEKGKKAKKLLRVAGGTVWEDNTLTEWDGDDFRIFCGDLGNDVTDEVLTRAFNRFPSFLKAKVVRDKRSNKTKGYGFVSYKDPQDFIKAMREMNGKVNLI